MNTQAPHNGTQPTANATGVAPPHSLEAKARTKRWETHDPGG